MLRLSFSSGPYALASAVAVALVAIGGLTARGVSAPSPEPLVDSLPGIWAQPVNVDTLFLGGYARGSFAEALPVLASELSGTERAMIGRHLDRIFLSLLPQGGLGSGGRLRVAYERVTRPDGSTRSIRVLAAEAAAGGK
ncbi:MAG: hypothetical protein M3483_03525, partial [Gemmatimonadota bacterium]|nr:hypothetical protein [Gemmatimonadota bacterium]